LSFFLSVRPSVILLVGLFVCLSILLTVKICLFKGDRL
jgi:hypothetical protein